MISGRIDRRRALEELLRSALEVRIVHPAPVDQVPVEVILEHLVRGPGDAALARGQAAIEIDAVFLLEVQADVRGVGDHGAAVLDVR